jgi:hypothetical protein
MLDIFSVAVVVIRGLAIVTFLNTISLIPNLWIELKQAADGALAYDSFTDSSFTAALVIVWLSRLALALLLFIFAKRLARFLTRGLGDTNVQIDDVNLRTVQRIAFSIIGAAVVVYAVPTLVKFLTVEFIIAAGNHRGASPISAPPKPEAIVEVVTQISVGLWLLVGSKRVAVWRKTILTKLKGAFGAD